MQHIFDFGGRKNKYRPMEFINRTYSFTKQEIKDYNKNIEKILFN